MNHNLPVLPLRQTGVRISYEDVENFYSIFGNQADDIDAAIVYKLTNSREALL